MSNKQSNGDKRIAHLFGLPINDPARPKLRNQVLLEGKALETAARKFTNLSPNFRGAGGLANYTIRDYSNATPTPDDDARTATVFYISWLLDSR